MAPSRWWPTCHCATQARPTGCGAMPSARSAWRLPHCWRRECCAGGHPSARADTGSRQPDSRDATAANLACAPPRNQRGRQASCNDQRPEASSRRSASRASAELPPSISARVSTRPPAPVQSGAPPGLRIRLASTRAPSTLMQTRSWGSPWRTAALRSSAGSWPWARTAAGIATDRTAAAGAANRMRGARWWDRGIMRHLWIGTGWQSPNIRPLRDDASAGAHAIHSAVSTRTASPARSIDAAPPLLVICRPYHGLMKTAWRLTVLAWLLCLAACTTLPSSPPHDAGTPRSLLLVSLDGVHPGDLGRGDTPRIDRLAREGVRAQWMAPSYPALTFPNHYTIVTGLRPDRDRKSTRLNS